MHRTTISLAVLALVAGLATPSLGADTYRLMTGPQGGVWVPIGGALKGMWEKAIPGLTIQTSPGAGIANVRGVDEGKAEIGFGNSISTVDGLNGAEPFPKKVTNVCQLATLYPQYFQIVVLASAKIDSIADLKGKILAVQTRGNTAEAISQHVLQVYGLNYQAMGKVNFMASYNDAVALLQDGHAHAFTLGTTIPASSVMDLGSVRDIKMLPMPDDKIAAMKKINAGYTKGTIKAGTYPKQTEDVPVIVYAAHLVASCKLPDAHVETMLRTLTANLADVVAINKAVQGLTPKMMAEDIGVPFHPGATKFYKQVGAM
ncbi:MAG: TAXI family TRAP transporter solute-binding subunit [Alphaproteobacteria bacterium]|nr:TAXI family TRAP transporter solute-binding subunit [Alphaproteobacteria bacterium]